jgi:hypothetical protein
MPKSKISNLGNKKAAPFKSGGDVKLYIKILLRARRVSWGKQVVSNA